MLDPMSDDSQGLIAPGARIGDHFVVERLLARGSVSELYAARADGGQQVVLKILMDSLGPPGSREHRIAYFLREAAVTAQVSHPNVVELLEVGFDRNVGHYLVLEYLPGQTLDQVVADEGPMSEQRARDIASQILGALQAAHRQGIIHRDLKPNNVQLLGQADDPDQVKLFDFGIAKLFDDSPAMKTLTQVDTLVGTPQWMSPEQCRGKALDERSDLYSVGAILYFLVSGQAPFENGPIMRVLNAVLSEPPRPVGRVRKALDLPALSRTLEKAIERALHKDPEQRFMDAAHFQAFLDRETPSIQWSAIRDAPLRRFASESPAMLAVRIQRDRGDSQTDLADVIDDLLDRLETDAEIALTHGRDALTLVFAGPQSPGQAVSEAAATGLRLLDALDRHLPGTVVRLLAAAGDPTLGLYPDWDDGAPLVDHLHDLLRDLARWSGEALVTASGHYRVTALTNLTGSGLYVPPEWIPELRPDFEIVRLVPGLHGIGQVLAQRDPREEIRRAPASELILEALCGQHAGMALLHLEEALYLSADPIEVLAAISDLQSADLIRIGSTGRAHIIQRSDGSYPRTGLPPVERRLLFLRIFSVLSEKTPEEGGTVAVRAENLESAHRLSAVRLWMEQAGASDDPAEAERALYRALRLASTRTPHESIAPILDALAAVAAERASRARQRRQRDGLETSE
jgi:serine/threonine protein kinase